MFLAPFTGMLPRVPHRQEPATKMARVIEGTETPLGKNNASVMSVAKSSVRAQPSRSIRGSTAARGLSHVTCVPRRLAAVRSSPSIGGPTRGRGPTGATSAGKPSARAPISSGTARATRAPALGGSQSIYSELFPPRETHGTSSFRVQTRRLSEQCPFQGQKGENTDPLGQPCLLF